jgi:hypothetical protein
MFEQQGQVMALNDVEQDFENMYHVIREEAFPSTVLAESDNRKIEVVREFGLAEEVEAIGIVAGLRERIGRGQKGDLGIREVDSIRLENGIEKFHLQGWEIAVFGRIPCLAKVEEAHSSVPVQGVPATVESSREQDC